MFLIQYWAIIGWAKLQRKWRKWLKTKEQLEQEARLKITVERFLKQLRQRKGLQDDITTKTKEEKNDGQVLYFDALTVVNNARANGSVKGTGRGGVK